jgi:hypothetical protein
MQYVNALNANSFTVDICAYEQAGFNNFNQLAITFTDSVNLNEKVTFTLTQQEGVVNANISNKQNVNIGGSFLTDSINFAVKNGNSVYDGTKFLTTIENFDNGIPFSGFSSGKIYVDFTIKNVTGNSAFYVRNFNGQTMFIICKSN